MTDIILYYSDNSEYKNFDRFRFYDLINNQDIKDIKDIKIDNLWVDYSSFDMNDDTNDIKILIKWILYRKYSITCPMRDITDIKGGLNGYIARRVNSTSSLALFPKGKETNKACFPKGKETNKACFPKGKEEENVRSSDNNLYKEIDNWEMI